MQYDEFITRVQQRRGFGSPEEAVQVTRATLETLGERLSRVETRQRGGKVASGCDPCPSHACRVTRGCLARRDGGR